MSRVVERNCIDVIHYDGGMGLTIDKILVIMVIAMFILGPERLPLYAKKLADLVRTVKKKADGAKDRLREEMGPEFDEVDWKQLDPRQYDPRRIVRDALLEDEKEAQAELRRNRASHTSQTRRIGGVPSDQATDLLPADSASALAGTASGLAVSGLQPDSPAGHSDADASAPTLFFDEEAT